MVCTEVEETTDHVLVQCPRVREIWSSSPILLLQSVESAQVLILLLRSSIWSPRSWEEGILRAYLAYHVWLDMNASIFEGRRLSLRMVVNRVISQSEEVITASALFTVGMARDIWGTSSTVTVPRFALISCVPPPLGYLKVNFDGSMSVDGTTGGVGFVIRDSCGKLVAARGQRTLGLTIVGAELRAA
ncbi:uncharacterized protein LOC120105721 [Phoenix dactylifera]|uniref:Uncharacterized protein LOC120105721 n=1 Tax=Phoenix dactylifera TaxID=42345 RepID=A0A8B8ZSF3_PHODC|nr:uncharacterized protein LOC120105721 [Phoenix dactylifera]